MEISAIIAAMSVIGISAAVVGIALGFFSENFKVEEDPKISQIRQCLPGANCGGCGYAGCDACARAIARGEAKVNACVPGGSDAVRKIAGIMGVDSQTQAKQLAAFVRCSGNCENTTGLYSYSGIRDCQAAALVPGKGGKSCRFGCIGFGSCIKVCTKNAIHIEKGTAVIDEELCGACGACVKVCPQHIIELAPKGKAARVVCSNTDRGKKVTDVCKTGCIGCGICVKKCPKGALLLENNLARTDYEKCESCGECAAACPKKVITTKIQ